MPDERLTNLTEFAGTLSPDDWVYFVDTSDTTENAAGSSFKIKVRNIVGRVLIQTITNASPGEFDFASIPSGYNRLIIKGNVRGDVAAVSEGVRLFLNADTTEANYHTQYTSGSNGTTNVSELSASEVAVAPGASSPTDSYSNVEFVIEDYTGARLKQVVSRFAAYVATDNIWIGSVCAVSAVTAAVTRIRVRTDNHATDQLLGTLRLYGEM